MKNIEEHCIKSYSMAELGQLYSPSLSVSAATKQLLRWMERHPNLIPRLPVSYTHLTLPTKRIV